MIAPYFVPRRRVGSLRPFKFAIHLKQYGWNPTILTIKDSKNKLSEQERTLLDGISIIEITPPFDRTVKQGNTFNEKNKTSSKSLSATVSNWFDKQIPIDSWMMLFRFKYNSIRKNVQQINPDLIWSTGDPWSGHWLGYKLSKNLSKPWIADFRDPWTLSDINLRDRSSFSSKRDSLWEKKFVQNANKLTFTARSTEKLYKDHYSLHAKTDTIYNSFDDTISEKSKSWEVDFDDKYLNILFFGRFRRLSPAYPIIKALHNLSSKNTDALKKIRIHSFGEMEPEDVHWVEKYELKDQFINHKPVLPQQGTSVLNKADLLLVSTNEKRKYIIPAKLWEYIQVDKPILSIAPNSEIADILEETGTGIQFPPQNISEIAQYLIECVESKKQLFSNKGYSSKKRVKFTAQYTAKQLSKIMDELTVDG